jgi:hypothetical protein
VFNALLELELWDVAALLPEDATIHTTTPRVARTRTRRRAISGAGAG